MIKTLPHLITTNDLFCNFDSAKLKGEGNIKRKYKCADKKSLIKRIFLRYLYLLMTDMVEGGKVFLFPNKKHMELRFRRIPDHQLKKAIQSGAYSKLDILMTDRKAYELVLSYKVYGSFIDKPVKLSDNFRSRIMEKMNTGYKYC